MLQLCAPVRGSWFCADASIKQRHHIWINTFQSKNFPQTDIQLRALVWSLAQPLIYYPTCWELNNLQTGSSTQLQYMLWFASHRFHINRGDCAHWLEDACGCLLSSIRCNIRARTHVHVGSVTTVTSTAGRSGLWHHISGGGGFDEDTVAMVLKQACIEDVPGHQHPRAWPHRDRSVRRHVSRDPDHRTQLASMRSCMHVKPPSMPVPVSLHTEDIAVNWHVCEHGCHGPAQLFSPTKTANSQNLQI